MKHVYFFSGLGADERVFKFLNIEHIHAHFIQWEIPSPQESLKEYIPKITRQIQTENPIFIGVSFGGLIAIECAKLISTEKIILISSIKTKNDIPFIYTFFKQRFWYSIFPFEWTMKWSRLHDYLFGVQNKKEQLLLRDIIRNTNPIFLKWALFQLVNWNNEVVPVNCIHIHGTLDKLLPLPSSKIDYILKDGGHFMIVSQAQKISPIIQQEIQ